MPVDGTLSTIESEKSRIVKAGIPLSCGFGNVNLKNELKEKQKWAQNYCRVQWTDWATSKILQLHANRRLQVAGNQGI